MTEKKISITTIESERFYAAVEKTEAVLSSVGNEKDLEKAVGELKAAESENNALAEAKADHVKALVEEAIENTDPEILEKGILIIDGLGPTDINLESGETVTLNVTMQDVKGLINQESTGNLIHSLVANQFDSEGNYQQTNVMKVPESEKSFQFIGEGYHKTGDEKEGDFVHPGGFFMAIKGDGPENGIERAVEQIEKQLPDLEKVEGNNAELVEKIEAKIESARDEFVDIDNIDKQSTENSSQQSEVEFDQSV